ncbi:hypothetical protein [Salinispora arenicola]|uniref:hypothetical protein n=1 Tax=Salinispora arenicola TaxID=168697 RepID=UPI0003188592|nr:hypothetical protein [Salinispora arenicola]
MAAPPPPTRTALRLPRRVKAADHGRGPIQLSWNLTYDVAGNALTIFSINGSPDV